jgi:hypothetical protein
MAAVAMTTMDRLSALRVVALVSVGRGPMRLKKTGHKLKFKDVMLGQPFHDGFGRWWTRVDIEAAAEIKGSTWVGALVCWFPLDAEVYDVERGR